MPTDLWLHAIATEQVGGRPAADPIYIEAFRTAPPPDVPLALLRHAQLLFAAGEPDRAEAALTALAAAGLLDGKQVAEAWLEVATIRMGRNDIPATVSALERIVEDGAGDAVPRALRNIGTFLEDHYGDLTGAEQAYRAALGYQGSPHAVGAAVNLGQLLDRTDRWGEADALWQTAADSAHPVESSRAAVLRAIALSERGRHDEAFSAFVTAAQGSPSEWTARAAFNAGVLLLDGRPRYSAHDAATFLDIATAQFAEAQLTGEHAMASVCLADALLQSGQRARVPQLLAEAERYGGDVVREQVAALRQRAGGSA